VHSENPVSAILARINSIKLVNPLGPHHCLICSGFVQAFQTVANSASNKSVAQCSLSAVLLFSFCILVCQFASVSACFGLLALLITIIGLAKAGK
jgi:hypothetical protein